MPIDEAATLLEVTRTPAAGVIDFFEARDRLTTGLEESNQSFEINRKAGKVAIHRLPSIERVDRFEESVYWVLSAAMLVYLFFGVVGH
jgi:hypothetical protein